MIEPSRERESAIEGDTSEMRRFSGYDTKWKKEEIGSLEVPTRATHEARDFVRIFHILQGYEIIVGMLDE
jgi:hypothetical protein